MLNFLDLDEVGELRIEGSDLDGSPIIGSRTYPTYTCGHCSYVIIMRPDRKRDRKRCTACRRVLCEKNRLCMEECTPLPDLARDHMEAPDHFKRLAPAILSGCNSLEEGLARGLIIP